jgi:hypothetical protein
MRENRLSGSEGGATLIPSSLPLSITARKERTDCSLLLRPTARGGSEWFLRGMANLHFGSVGWDRAPARRVTDGCTLRIARERIYLSFVILNSG